MVFRYNDLVSALSLLYLAVQPLCQHGPGEPVALPLGKTGAGGGRESSLAFWGYFLRKLVDVLYIELRIDVLEWKYIIN